MGRTPKPPLSEWLVAQRKARGESVEDIARLLDRSPATIRGWEAGRPPSAEDASVLLLERHYDSQAPRAVAGDQSALVVALMAQTAALNELAAAIRDREETLATVVRGLAEVQTEQSEHIASLERVVQRLYERGPEGTQEPTPRPGTAGSSMNQG